MTINCKLNPLKYLHYPFKFKPKKYPSNLKSLGFSHEFNDTVDNLPKGLVKLFFGDKFNQPINNLP